MFLKQSFFQKISVLATLAVLGGLWGDSPVDFVGQAGCLPLTDEEFLYLDTSADKIVEILPNELAIKRGPEKKGAKSLKDKQYPEVHVKRGSISEALSAIPLAASLPSSVDNSQLPSFPPIGYQALLGACVPFSSTYYQATHEIGLANGTNNKTSANGILSPKWTYNLINQGVDHGSSPLQAFALLNRCGAPSNLQFPYDTNFTEWDKNPSDWVSALSNRTTPVSVIPGLGGYQAQNLTAIKQALANGHVVSFGTYIYSWVYTHLLPDPANPNSPYVGQMACYYMKGTTGPHMITIVGYDDNLWIDVNGNGVVDEGERGAFLVANSWSNVWGNKGFLWISYDAFLGTSLVANAPSPRVPAAVASNHSVYYITAKSLHYKPSLIGQFSLTQTMRNQIGLSFGWSPVEQLVPFASVTFPPLYFAGGSGEFDGTVGSIPQTFTFAADLSDFLMTGFETSALNYHLTITDSAPGSSTTLNSFNLIDKVHNKTISNPSSAITFDNNKINNYITYDFSQDMIPPSISFTSPVNGSVIKGTYQVILNAADNSGIKQVDLYSDSVLMATDLTAPYAISLDTTALVNGQHSLKAVATDLNGNTGSATILVTVQNDITPPVVAITAPTNGKTVSGTVQITANAADNVAVASVVFYVDATQIGVDTASPYSISLNTKTQSNGLHEIRAVATDTSGNLSTASILVNVQNTTLPPGLYLNGGGPPVSFGGVTWVPDTGYQTGSAGTYSHDVATANPVYDTQRLGNASYGFFVSNGTHQVTLKFAEIQYTSSGSRVFNVSINGKQVISNLDIFAKVGFGVPYDLTFPVNVTNQKVVIQLSSVKNLAAIAAIQVTPL